MFFVDYWYIVLVLPAVLLSVIAQIYIKITFNKYKRIPTASGINGFQTCGAIAQENGLNIDVEGISGSLSDHFDPRSNVVRLSESVGPVSSVASVGVAAHEMGHALQYAKGYAPIKIRAAILPTVQISSTIAPFLILAGLVFSAFKFLLPIGIVLYSFAIVFQLVTLPVEINASRRALAAIKDQGLLTDEERQGARKVLTAAALTYVASLIVSLMQLIRLIIISSKRR